MFNPPMDTNALDPSLCVREAANAALSLGNKDLCSDLITALYSYFEDDTDSQTALSDQSFLKTPDIAASIRTGARTASLLATLFTRSDDLRRWDGLINALDIAIYTTDPDGRLSHYNIAAGMLWGWQPALHQQRYCGAWRLAASDGTDLPHEKSPMATCLHERRAVRGQCNVAQQPSGARRPFAAFPTPISDRSGTLVGAFNVAVDLSNTEAQAALRAA